ncbi:cytochrome c1, heme protein, mitochondrial-like [Ylistrum balloti]|uniref:cytochrome c1, heme protein, mitochondrial-like n=1 Tax=Ylistrum balloti TaxID=509963 RepID=UPI002905E638|nr:cytochrome c1, heme protein, mitochondrial-like [Ylistrum balloti]
MAAAVVCKVPKRALLRVNSNVITQQAETSTFKEYVQKKSILVKAAVGSAVVGTIGVGAAVFAGVSASAHGVHPPTYAWGHRPFLASLDMASVRRGYEVYKQVCAACHSIKHMRYRYMTDVFMSPKRAAQEASEIMTVDGPDKDGNMFERPGKVIDPFPVPYANKEAAQAANNGAAPPDMSYIVLSREGTEDYIFSLLTGYSDPPAGLELGEGQYYNPYFPGGVLAMAPPLYNDIIEYEDGTPATKSQLAKDVITFLKWVGEPEFDERKIWAIRAVPLFLIFSVVVYYYKRHKFSYLKSMALTLKKEPVKKTKMFPTEKN